MITATFWIIISFSDGYYNRGNMDELSIHFPTEASCQLTLDQINEFYKTEWGNNINKCIKVEY